MSNQSEVASYIQAFEQNNIDTAVLYAMFALLLYDYLLNFSREVNFIWSQKFGLLSFLYILNYYPQIFSWLLETILNSYTPHCTAVLQASDFLGILPVIASIAFQITRTYAVWGQSWIVASSLVLLAIPLIVLYFWTTFIHSCTNFLTSPSYEKYNTVANITGLLFMIFVVILTVIRTFQSAREHQKLYKAINYNLAVLILANGALYFIAILSLNILELAFYFCGLSYLESIVSNITFVISTILISRFMLALREKANNPNGSRITQLTDISSLHVAVANIQSVIVEEFGDTLYHTLYELRHSSNTEDIALEDMHTPHAAISVTAPIDIEEFPWAAGEIEVVEADRELAVQDVT